jgi:hypothetical protein
VWIGFDQPATIISNGYAGELAVPLWASVMKSATKGDKPDWFERPANVIAVNVCRVSGKLPNSGCDSVEGLNRDGETQSRSMVYTEYFVKGTQPNTLCPEHPSPSFMDRLAAVFGGNSEKPVAAEHMGLPQIGTSGAPIPPAPLPDAPGAVVNTDGKAEEPKKKRGFWAKVFGGKDQKNDAQKPDEKKKKPGGG